MDDEQLADLHKDFIFPGHIAQGAVAAFHLVVTAGWGGGRADIGDTDCVVHIRPRVVRDICFRPMQQFDFARIHLHAVRGDGFGSEDSQGFQSLTHALLEFF